MRPHKVRNTWIDLDHVLAISDARFIDRMGSGGWYVGFDVTMAFLNKPLLFMRDLERGEEIRFDHDGGYHQARLVAGTWTDSPGSLDHPREILAVSRLQLEVDVLVTAWQDTPPGRQVPFPPPL